jgi:S1-C subfamily serine protease
MYTVNGLAPGPAKLLVRAAGHAPATKSVKIPETGGARPYTLPRIELAAEGIVEGVVVDARGDPVQGARVAKDRVPTYLAIGATPAGVAVTDARGRFKLTEVPEGDVTLEGYAADVGRARVHGVRVVAGRSTVDVKITLEKLEKAADPASSGGVAVTLGETSEPREVVLVAVAQGSEAERAGLAPNDVIVEIDGAVVRTIEEARAKLNGPIGDDVVVKLRRGERTETLRVAREQVRR